ncbi:mucin TcMUCII, partial [Trypanosoma cruzi]
YIFCCASLHILCSLFSTSLLCVSAGTHNHTHKMHIAVDLNAPFVVHAGSCVWRLRCNSACVTAAGSPGDVSVDADAVVVPVDVSCAPSDGSLSYRVCVCLWAWKKCSAASAEAQ